MKRVLVLFLLATAGTAAAFFYFWNSATDLPDWYTDQPKDSQVSGLKSQDELQQSQEQIESRIAANAQPAVRSSASVNQPKSVDRPSTNSNEQPQTTNNNQPVTREQSGNVARQGAQSPKKDVAVKLNKSELNDLVASDFVRKNDGSKLAQAVRAVNTEVQNGKIESGAVVSLANIPVNQLQDGEKDTLSRIFDAFPALREQDVYIAIEGEPTVENGQLKFGENSRIRLGNLSFTASEIAQRLGVPEEEVRKRINLELQLRGLDVNDVKLIKDGIVLQGSAQPKE
jgi:hypothetical protein